MCVIKFTQIKTLWQINIFSYSYSKCTCYMFEYDSTKYTIHKS